MSGTEHMASWAITDDGVDIVDRSTLERWATCPAMGAAVERGHVCDASVEAASGQAVHDAIARVTAAIAAGAIWKPAEARQAIEADILNSRPDVQADAMRAAMACAWMVCDRLLCHPNGEPRYPDDLLRFDGGEGERSGQIAHDLIVDGKPHRITCELDLLLPTESPDGLEIVDYKTGRGEWTETTVAGSFQFATFYPALVLLNYPTCQSVRVRVLNARTRVLTPPVYMHRGRPLTEALARIESAIRIRETHRATKFSDLPAWPDPDRCAICPAAGVCPRAMGDVREVATDPAASVLDLVATEARAARLTKLLAEHVRAYGEIDAGNGVRFGIGKPVSRRPSASVYSL